MKYYKPFNIQQKTIHHWHEFVNTGIEHGHHEPKQYKHRTDRGWAFHEAKYPNVNLTNAARTWLNQGRPLENQSKTQISKAR